MKHSELSALAIERIINQKHNKQASGNDEYSIENLFMTVGKTKIPLTDDEFHAMDSRIKAYIEEHGISFGFVDDLLTDK